MSIYNLSLTAANIVNQITNQYGTVFLLRQNATYTEACLFTPAQFTQTYTQHDYAQLLKALPTLKKISFTIDSLAEFSATLPLLQYNQQHKLRNLLVCEDRQHFRQLYQCQNIADLLVYDLLALKVYADLLPQLDKLLTEIVLHIKMLEQHSLTIVLVIEAQAISPETLFNLRSILSQLYEVCIYSTRFSIVIQYLLDDLIDTQTWEQHIDQLINKMPLWPVEIINRQHACPAFRLQASDTNIIHLPDGSSITVDPATDNNLLFLPQPTSAIYHHIAFYPNDLLPQIVLE